MTLKMDPELVEPYRAWYEATSGGIDLSDIPRERKRINQVSAASVAKVERVEDISSEDHFVPGAFDAPDVFVRIYRPAGLPEPLPALLWIHGGGWVLGSVERDDLTAQQLAKAGDCVVVSVEYRLAPESSYPEPLEDCYAALKWLSENRQNLGVDPKRIAIGGASAGGNLAAGLALLARDRGEVEVCYQLLIYPALDDCNVLPAGKDRPETYIWTRQNNRMGWQAYLGCEPGGVDVSCYAAPARAVDLAGLPAAYISVGDLDLFLNENIMYAQRLLATGVPCELHVYSGGFHGFNIFAPNTDLSKRFCKDRDGALKRNLYPAGSLLPGP